MVYENACFYFALNEVSEDIVGPVWGLLEQWLVVQWLVWLVEEVEHRQVQLVWTALFF